MCSSKRFCRCRLHHGRFHYPVGWKTLSEHSQSGGGGGGGGGFFLACEDFGRMFDNSFPAYAFFFPFKVEISSRTLIPLLRPGSAHSGSASWDDYDSVPWWVVCELVFW